MPDSRKRAPTSGLETLADHDLLAVLLGTSATGKSALKLAARLLESEGGLLGLSRITAQGLSERGGVGPMQAVRIAAAFELGRRAQTLALTAAPPRLLGFDEVVAWAQPRFSLLDHEEVWLLTLDGQNALKSSRKIAQGGAHGCALTTRDVLSPALRDAANAIVLVHNHPSGDPTPSPEDVHMTRAVAAACDVVGIALLDHVVVARGGASSLFERGAF